MTQQNQERSDAQPDRPEQIRVHSLAAMASRQRIAIGCAVGAAGVIAICALTLSRPLPAVGPPPSGIAPLLTAESPTTVNSAPGANTEGAPLDPGVSATPAAPSAAPIGAQAYLAFVKQIDQQRAAMMASFDTAVAGTGQGRAPQEFAMPGSPASSATSVLSQTAQSVQSAYQAQAAPTECAALATAYTKLLQDQTAMVAQASPLIGSGDLRDAAAIQAEAQSRIESDAAASDQALSAEASAAQITKPFAVVADPGQSAAAAMPAPSSAGQTGGAPGGSLAPIGNGPATTTPPTGSTASNLASPAS